MTTPRTAAGRALLAYDDSADGLTPMELRKGVLAIEAEAAEPYRKALEACGEDWPGEGGWHLLSCDASEPHWPICEQARALLRREVGD